MKTWGLAPIALVLAACGSTAEPGADGGVGTDAGELGADAAPASTRPKLGPALDPPAAYYRVDLERTPGGVRLVGAALLEAREGVGAPVVAHRGELLAVSRGQGTVKEAVPVAFPSLVLREGRDGDGKRFSLRSEVESARASVFVRASGVDRLQVLTSSGTVALEVPLPPPSRRNLVDELSAELPYALVLTDDADRPFLPEALRDDAISILTPSAADRALLLEAFRRVAPAARGAVHVVALVTLKDRGRVPLAGGKSGVILAIASGNGMILNAEALDDREELITTVVHEAAHNFHYLVDGESMSAFVERWPMEVRAAVRATIERRLLGDGLSKLWIDLHVGASVSMLARAYLGEMWSTITEAAAIDGGFASDYGSDNVYEDVAEYVRSIQGVGPSSAFCKALAGWGTIDERHAISWAKANLVVGLGLVTDEAFAACAQDTALLAAPGARVGQHAFDVASGYRVRVTTDFSESTGPASTRCPGPGNRALCGKFMPTMFTRALTLEAQFKYSQFGYLGGVPPGWTAPAPVPIEYFQLGVVVPPGASLLGVRRISRRDASPVSGGALGPIANMLYARVPPYDVFLGSDASGLLIVTRADAMRFEGMVAFPTFLYLAGRNDPRDGKPAALIPLITFRVDAPPGTPDPCCDP